MIVSCLLSHTPHKQLYWCGGCSDEDKAWRGCGTDVGHDVLTVDCPCSGTCGCTVCDGYGSFVLRRCPVDYALDKDTQLIKRFFMLWRIGNKSTWPDGLPPIDQPSSLISAFSLMDNVTSEGEARDIRSMRSEGKQDGNYQ